MEQPSYKLEIFEGLLCSGEHKNPLGTDWG